MRVCRLIRLVPLFVVLFRCFSDHFIAALSVGFFPAAVAFFRDNSSDCSSLGTALSSRQNKNESSELPIVWQESDLMGGLNFFLLVFFG